jgi:hypothetical protein
MVDAHHHLIGFVAFYEVGFACLDPPRVVSPPENQAPGDRGGPGRQTRFVASLTLTVFGSLR